ncbi:hypothetical protein ACHQM5_019362 [Ranunculus cassubicifolius]
MSEVGIDQETNLLDGQNSHLVDDEEEDDEEEDVDFNPFLKECSSPEASSSISSDDEGGDGNNVGGTFENKFTENSVERLEYCMENDEKEVELESCDVERRNKRKFGETSEDLEEEFRESGGDRVVEEDENVDDERLDFDVNVAVDDEDEEDAICRRTRARYSLANCTLDELETFLQETDDDEDLQNVDDEQEYKKFLAAVLQGGENDEELLQENENVDDDDEDSDVDFEIELEEALDSDFDENVQDKKKEERRGGRRPKTREKNSNKMFLGQANKPLRPLVPIPPSACLNLQMLPPKSFVNCPPAYQSGQVIGFTPQQIGQLHCLIHEHAQLLVQVFSLSVLDPSRQSVADETRELISELVRNRNKALSWRKVPYPDYCFRPPYIHPSVSKGVDGAPYIHPFHVPTDSSSARPYVGGRRFDGPYVDYTKDAVWVPQVGGPVVSILDAAPLRLVGSYMDDVSRVVQDYQKRHVEGLYFSRFEKAPLFPIPNTPISPETNNEALRSATFQSPTLPSSLNVDQSPKKSLAAALIESTKKQSIAFVPKEIVTLAQRFYAFFNSALYPHKPPPIPVAKRVCFTDSEDKLLAMGIMEYNTDWDAIKQRFLPCKSKHQIFVRQKNRCSSRAPDNPIKAVRQMKTSPLTAEEKGRIFQGLKIFKNDWVAVGKFMLPYRDPTLLPRQWRIALGTQKSYKSDEAKRKKRHLYEMQRRLRKAPPSADCQTASEREDNVAVDVADENRSDNDDVEDEDEAYVHEAFLADWRPGNSRPEPLGIENSCANQVRAVESNGRLPSENHNITSSVISQHLQNVSHFTQTRYTASYTTASKNFSPDSLPKSSKSQVKSQPRRVTRKKDAQLVKLAPDLPPVNLPSSVRVISQSAFSSYRSAASHSNKISSTAVEREKSVPTVPRVAKSGTAVAVDSGNKGSSAPTVPPVAKSGTTVPVDSGNKERNVPAVLHVAKSGTSVSVDSGNKGRNIPSGPRVAKPGTAVPMDSGNKANTPPHSTASLCPEDPRVNSDQVATKDNISDITFQIHPLLLRAPEDGRFPYFPANSSACASNTFNFIEGNQLQANFSNFGKPSDADSTIDASLSLSNSSRSCTIDFHPLLQRNDDGNFGQHRHSSESSMTVRHVTSGPQAAASVPASPDEVDDELDLEIHLSSTSRKRKITTGGKVTAHNFEGLLNLGIIKETNKVDSVSQARSENFLTSSLAASSRNQEHLIDNNVLVSPNNTSRFAKDNARNQSLPEIVMEQEELSDSEEEKGEDVEFECEEMDDSEREE